MQEYAYVAKDNQGRTLSDELYAINEAQAIRILHERELTIIKLDLLKEPSLIYKWLHPIKQELLVLYFRQMSAMISAGIPVVRTLQALRENEGLPPRFRKALNKVCGDVMSGYSLSRAMRVFPEYFSPFMTGSIRIGEISGKLPETLKNCANHLEKEYAYNLKLRQALIYPFFLLTSLGLLMSFCFAYMIPKFIQLFADVEIQLPWPTLMLLGCSNFLERFGSLLFWTIIAPLAFGCWLAFHWLRTKRGRWQSEYWLLHLPWYGHQAALRMQSRYFRSLSTLMRSSIPLMTSLQVLSESLEQEMLRAAAVFQMSAIKNGGSLSSGLRRSGIFQPLALELVSVGEEAGETAEIMERIAVYLDEEMSQNLQLLSRLIEPIVLCILGAGTAFILLAAFMPIYSLAQSF